MVITNAPAPLYGQVSASQNELEASKVSAVANRPGVRNELEASKVSAVANRPAPIAATVPAQNDSDDREALDFLRDTTINLTLDGYYGYNFNRSIGGINLLRAYDVVFGRLRSRWDILLHGSIINRFLHELRDATVQVVPVERNSPA
jgi:hypothetical protein